MEKWLWYLFQSGHHDRVQGDGVRTVPAGQPQLLLPSHELSVQLNTRIQHFEFISTKWIHIAFHFLRESEQLKPSQVKSNRSAELLINTRGSFDVLYYKEGQTSTDIFPCFSVGYDERKMLLNGKFSYKKKNQRTLPFNVDIEPLPLYKQVFRGSSSKCFSTDFNLS